MTSDVNLDFFRPKDDAISGGASCAAGQLANPHPKMKSTFVIAPALALCWLGWTQFATLAMSAEPGSSLKTSTTPAAYPQMSLSEVLQPNSLFSDAVFGVAVTYPVGWSVQGARRWDDNNHENTVLFAPPATSHAVPSMYYKLYTVGAPPPDGPPALDATEAFFRATAQTKEKLRTSNGLTDYKNVPESFEFTQIGGHPAMTYFAAFTQGNQVMTEHFIRILGQKGFVMFFTSGTLDDVKALMPQLHQMAATVQVP